MRKSLIGIMAVLMVLSVDGGLGLTNHAGGHGGGTPYICEYGEDKTYTGVVASVTIGGGKRNALLLFTRLGFTLEASPKDVQNIKVAQNTC